MTKKELAKIVLEAVKTLDYIENFDMYFSEGSLHNYVKNGNKEVGQVTIMFNIAHCLQSKPWVLAIPFIEKILGEAVKERSGKYISPVPVTFNKETGLRTAHISKAVIMEVFSRARTMEFNEENIMAFLHDLEDIGRFYQELTIDDTKNSRGVKIPQSEELASIKPMSRLELEKFIRFTFDWDKGEAIEELIEEPATHIGTSREYSGGKGDEVLWNKDFNMDVKEPILDSIRNMANTLAGVKQVIPDEVLAELQEANKHSSSHVFNFLKNMSWDIARAARAEKEEIRKAHGEIPGVSDKLKLAEMDAQIEKSFQWARKAVTDMLRELTAQYEGNRFALTDLERGLLGMAVGMDISSSEDDDVSASNFCRSTLPEEYVLAATHLSKLANLEIEDQTKTRLSEVIGIEEDGEYINFDFGYYEEEGRKAICLDEPLDGEYFVVKEEQGWVAYGEGFESVKAPKSSGLTLFSMRAPVGKDYELYHAVARLMGHEVILSPENGDAIYIDGELSPFKFWCSYRDENGRVRNSAALNQLYRGKRGKVKFCSFYEFDEGGHSKVRALVVIGDTDTVDTSNMPKATVEEVKAVANFVPKTKLTGLKLS